MQIWNKYTDTADESCVSKKKINDLLEELNSICEPVRKYANKHLAHLVHSDKKDQSILTYEQLWRAATHILRLIKDLNSLLNYVGISFLAIPQYNKYEHLRVAWWNAEYYPKKFTDIKEEFGILKDNEIK